MLGCAQVADPNLLPVYPKGASVGTIHLSAQILYVRHSSGKVKKNKQYAQGRPFIVNLFSLLTLLLMVPL